MKQMLIVIKETYLRHVKSWSFVFMVLSPFLFLGLSLGIGYLQGSSMASSQKVAVLTQLDSVREVLRAEDQLTFDYKDEAAAKQAVKDKKIAGYLMIEERDGQLSATYYAETSMNAATKMALSNSLIQVQQALNLAQAELSDEQSQILARTVQFEEKIDENKESKTSEKATVKNVGERQGTNIQKSNEKKPKSMERAQKSWKSSSPVLRRRIISMPV